MSIPRAALKMATPAVVMLVSGELQFPAGYLNVTIQRCLCGVCTILGTSIVNQ